MHKICTTTSETVDFQRNIDKPLLRGSSEEGGIFSKDKLFYIKVSRIVSTWLQLKYPQPISFLEAISCKGAEARPWTLLCETCNRKMMSYTSQNVHISSIWTIINSALFWYGGWWAPRHIAAVVTDGNVTQLLLYRFVLPMEWNTKRYKELKRNPFHLLFFSIRFKRNGKYKFTLVTTPTPIDGMKYTKLCCCCCIFCIPFASCFHHKKSSLEFWIKKKE